MDKSIELHKTWHSFCNYMKRWYYVLGYGWNKDLKRSKRKYKSFDSTKMVGYDAMCRIEKYSKGNNNILISRCDDSSFMGSNIALISHETDDYFMGTTMILVPQNKTDINQVFLYPDDINSLIKNLQEMQKRAKEKKADWDIDEEEEYDEEEDSINFDLPEDIYCLECGEEKNLTFQYSYANGDEYQCRKCGNKFMF